MMRSSSFRSFIRRCFASPRRDARKLGRKCDLLSPVGRLGCKRRIGNRRGKIPVGKLRPELRLALGLLVGDHDTLRQRPVTEPLDDQRAGPPTSPEARADAQRALEAIQRLPEAYRETLVLRLVEGLTGPEIARLTGLTPDSVRVNLHRGMKLLRDRLERRPS